VTVQIAERALNELLVIGVGSSTHTVVELLPDNVVVLRRGVFHARAALPLIATPSSNPRVTLQLASVIVAMALKAFAHHPSLEIHGRQLTVDLTQVPALQPWRDLWRHVERLTLETAPGALRVGLEAGIVQQGGADTIEFRTDVAASGVGERMREWIEAQLAEGFPALSGSQMSGTLALRQDVANELIAKWLARAAQPTEGAALPDVSRHVRYLKSATIRAESGTLFIDFTIAV
jgi:hypothetical protein